MRISFIRHFKIKGNLEKRYVGKTDEDILRDEVFFSYPEAEIVFTSCYKRCLQTAKLIYPQIDTFQCRKLNETDFGDFEYKNFEELKDNEDYKAWLSSGGEDGFPQGESKVEFCKRSLEGFLWAVEFAKEKKLGEIAFVIHGGSIMAILSGLAGGGFYDYHRENGCGYLTEFTDGKLKILGEIK